MAPARPESSITYLIYANSLFASQGAAVVMLLVAEPVVFAAIRTLPGDGIAGHAPHVFQHTVLADAEPAATRPAEWKALTAAVADADLGSAVFLTVAGRTDMVLHSFTNLC
jgi:hypothetical protein